MDQQRPLVAEGSVSGMSASSSQPDADSHHLSQLSIVPQRKKKPGPKRDSKPAPNEKLERNRQAQRTHRERKEQYTKELEIEVLRLKELFAQAARERDGAIQLRDEAVAERDKLREENSRLREYGHISASTSIADSGYDSLSISWTCDTTRNSSISDASGLHSLTANATVQETIASPHLMIQQRHMSPWEIHETRGFASDDALMAMATVKSEHSYEYSMQTSSSSQIDYDELALDFVLTLERPCMGHIHYLHVRAHNFQVTGDSEMMGQPMEVPDDGENQHISGHALMATAPTYSHIVNTPHERHPTELPNLRRSDLIKLLNLSSQLQINEQEVPPVRVWIKLMQDERVKLLDLHDFEMLKLRLRSKVHCYRFGAIVDESDIEETLQSILLARPRPSIAEGPLGPATIMGGPVASSANMKLETSMRL